MKVKPWFPLSFIFIFMILFYTHANAQINKKIETLIASAELEEGASISIHAAQLTHYLEQNGFLLTRVLISEHDTLIVDLGLISKISISGLRKNNYKHAKNILEKLINTVPTEEILDRKLALINDMPGVNGSFTLDHIKDGNYELSFSGMDTYQFGSISIDNPPGEIGQEYRYNINQNFNGIFVGGDIVRFQGMWLDAGDNPNQTSIVGSYQFPIGRNGAYLEFGAGDYSTETEVHSRTSSFTTGFGTVIIPGSITTHDYEGQSYYIALGYPIKRTHDKALYLIGQVDYSVDETSDIGDTRVLHGDIGFFYSQQYPNGKSLHFGGYAGLGHNDSYVADESNDYWSGNFMGAYITPIPQIDNFTELRLEGLLKISDEHLPNSKLFSLGDEDFMRGYESSTALGSEGFAGTVEIAHAFYNKNYFKRIAPYAFLDVGVVNNPSSKSNNTNRPKNHELVSVGFGSHFSFAKNITLNTYVGIPLAEDVEGKLPNPSAYLRLSWSW